MTNKKGKGEVMEMKTMHGIAVAGMMAAMAMAAGAQTSATVKDDLFAGTEMFAKGATGVTEVNMGPETLGMVEGKDQSKAHRTVLSVVRTYTFDNAGMYRIEDVDTFRNKLNTGEWHCSVHTRNMKTGESTDVCNKQRSDDLKETAIITVEPKSLTFIHTIRRGGGQSWGPGSTYMLMPGGGMRLGSTDAALRAEMVIGMAEMHAQMAEMRAMNPGMSGLTGPMVKLDSPKLKIEIEKSLKLDGPEMQKKIDEAMKQQDDAKKQAAEKQDAEKEPK